MMQMPYAPLIRVIIFLRMIILKDLKKTLQNITSQALNDGSALAMLERWRQLLGISKWM